MSDTIMSTIRTLQEQAAQLQARVIEAEAQARHLWEESETYRQSIEALRRELGNQTVEPILKHTRLAFLFRKLTPQQQEGVCVVCFHDISSHVLDLVVLCRDCKQTDVKRLHVPLTAEQKRLLDRMDEQDAEPQYGCKKCDLPELDHMQWALAHLYVKGDEVLDYVASAQIRLDADDHLHDFRTADRSGVIEDTTECHVDGCTLNYASARTKQVIDASGMSATVPWIPATTGFAQDAEPEFLGYADDGEHGEHEHDFKVIGSWPSGPDGETDSLSKCSCGEMKHISSDDEQDGES